MASAIEGADVLVNLAGKSVNCRYTDANRAEILRSRVETTRQLHAAVSAAQHPPRVWFNASSATIYRHAMRKANTESSGAIGEGFSVDVATNWEREFFAGELPGTLNSTELDPACGPQVRLDNVRRQVDYAMNNAFGFGGNNCTLVFARA